MSVAAELHSLIHALTQNEKRFVRRFSMLQTAGRENNYMLLFEAMGEQLVYDEAELKARFAGEKFIQHLPSELHYLRGMVFKALRTYRDGRTKQVDVRDMIRDGAMLFEKGLLEFATRVFRKARTRAEKAEHLLALVEVLDWERKLLKKQNTAHLGQQLKAIAEQKARAMQDLRLESEVYGIYDELYLLVQKRFSLRAEERSARVQAMLEEAPLQGEALPGTFQTRILLGQSRALAWQLRGDYGRALQWYARAKNQWEEAPERLPRDLDRYLAAVSNYLNACCQLGHYERIPEELEKLPALQETDFYRYGLTALNYDLIYCLNTRDLARGEKIISQIEAWLQAYAETAPPGRTMAFRTNLALFHFVAGRYAAALPYVRQVMGDVRPDLREDLKNGARILHFVIHYELGNTELFDSLYRSTYRYLNRKGDLHPFEKAVLSFMRKWSQTTGGTAEKQLFEELQQELIGMRADPQEANAPGREELIVWLETKL